MRQEFIWKRTCGNCKAKQTHYPEARPCSSGWSRPTARGQHCHPPKSQFGCASLTPDANVREVNFFRCRATNDQHGGCLWGGPSRQERTMYKRRLLRSANGKEDDQPSAIGGNTCRTQEDFYRWRLAAFSGLGWRPSTGAKIRLTV